MMSSVSSHDGSDKDSLRRKTSTDGGPLPRYAALRKTDLLDAMDSLDRIRAGDTDSWSLAATIDDQESVISAQGNSGGLVGLSSSSTTTLDTLAIMSAPDLMASSSESKGDSATLLGGTTVISNASSDMTLDNNNHLLGNAMDLDQQTLGDDDDFEQRSRSNAAEFGDGGSTGFNMDSVSDDQKQQQHTRDNTPNDHHVVNDSITAPPQPQPSFAPATKSYVELLEENDMLQTQIDSLRTTHKHQSQVIEHLRSLTERRDPFSNKKQPQSKDAQTTPSISLQQTLEPISMMDQNNNNNRQEDTDHTPSLLERLYERIHQFVTVTLDMPYSLEQELFSAITDAYLVALPFGTDHQQLLNTAYRDQLRRFQSTLGTSFASWYRRQTVQSLSLNPATKEYLDQMQHQLTLQLMTLLTKHGAAVMVDQAAWMDILHWCRLLALKIHGGEADVLVHLISPGSDYDPYRMTSVMPADTTTTTTKKVKYALSPLFIDENDQVLLAARVILDE